MAGVAPVGVKRARASPRAAAAPASLSSSFTGAGFGKQIDGQRLSVSALAPAPGSRRGGSRCVTTMAAKIAGYIKLAIEAGKASPAPPIGPALGAKVRENISFDATTARAGRARGRARGRGGRTRAAGEGGRPRRERVSRGDASARGTTAGGDARARWRGRRARDGSMVAGDARGAVGTRVVR